LRALEKISSYRVQGFQFSPAFKARRWDGREHLLTFSKRDGYKVPTGLAVVFAKTLRTIGSPYEVVDETVVRHMRMPLDFVAPRDGVARDYQLEAKRAILSSPFVGRGIIKAPVRSGKTFTAAMVIARIGLPTLFVVPSKGLLHQTHAELSAMLPGVEIGLVGDGVYDPSFVTVSTIQTLSRLRGRKAIPKKGDKPGKPAIPRDPRFDELKDRFDLMILDEVHRIKGEGEWHLTAHDIDARYKVGLSATPFLDNKSEQSKGAIWMMAICGPVRIDISVSRLVESGYLMRQNVEIYKIRKPDMYGAGWSSKVRAKCIVHNRTRNRLIAEIARKHSRAGLKVLVIARFHEHMANLREAIELAGLSVMVVHGRHSKSRRDQAAVALAEGLIDCVIANVFGEGIDLPKVDCVIVAEGGKDEKQTVQRQRNLTIAEGKKRAVLVDFLDESNEVLERHSYARMEMYESEPSYRVEMK